MGFYNIDSVSIKRIYDNPRYLLVTWHDVVLDKEESKKFTFDELDEAMKYAQARISETAM